MPQEPNFIDGLEGLLSKKLRGWRADIEAADNTPTSFTLIFEGGDALEVSHKANPEASKIGCYFSVQFLKNQDFGLILIPREKVNVG